MRLLFGIAFALVLMLFVGLFLYKGWAGVVFGLAIIWCAWMGGFRQSRS